MTISIVAEQAVDIATEAADIVPAIDMVTDTVAEELIVGQADTTYRNLLIAVAINLAVSNIAEAFELHFPLLVLYFHC